MLLALGLLILAAIIFDFLNGFHDSSNIVATMIASRAFAPRTALAIVTVGEVLGPFLFGVAVAKTIGNDVVAGGTVTQAVVVSALAGAIVWNVITWWLGIPSSSSHALIGGIVGAVAMEHGFGLIKMAGIQKVLIALFVSPILGLLVGFLVQRFILHTLVAIRAGPSANKFFRAGQFFTAFGLALSHGTNDAQKTMGMITMGLVATGFQKEFNVPWWVMVISASAIGAGTASGGWRLIKTLGFKLYKIWPIHAFTAQFASASVILGAALLGGPVSTTQVVSGVILGAGASETARKVRWSLALNIATAWVLTIPAAGLVAAGSYHLIKFLMPLPPVTP
ncbi:MAG TPA: inorganic phosphate transporter [Myxococcales bacterium]|jgi:PiT family inorganic phosphate transporter